MKGNEANHSLFKSFSCAFKGLLWVSRNERNMQIHLAVAVATVFMAFWLTISLTEWALVVLAMALVVVAELINSAVEKTVDLITTDDHPLAGKAKDAAAGAVLLASFFSVLIGLFVFLPHIKEKLF